MEEFLSSQGLVLNFGKIVLPDWVETVKIDVGLSSNAPQSESWLAQDSKTLVFGFEPVSSNIESLIRGSSPWKVKINTDRIGKTFFLIRCALGSKSMIGKKEIHVTDGDSGRSSLLKPKKFSVASKEWVEVFRLQDFLVHFPFDSIPQIAHIKIDVQGADFEVLKGAGKYLKKISVVTVEVDQNDYQNTTNNFKRIRIFMLRYLHIYVRHPQKWNVWFEKFNLKIKINTHDPTFINLRHLLRYKSSILTATQFG